MKRMKALLFGGAVFALGLLYLGCGEDATRPQPEPEPSITLRSPENQFDYIIIAPDVFQTQMAPLISLRESRGLKLVMVDVAQIFEEFPVTESPQESIRDFLSYALTNWQAPSPRFVLLVGNTGFIPAYRVKSRFADQPLLQEDSVSIDEFFVVNKNELDQLPDAAIGRLPVATDIELQNLIEKTLAFENSDFSTTYANELVVLLDEAVDENNVFEHAVGDALLSSLPLPEKFARIDIRETSEFFGDRETLFQTLANGTVFFSYFGYGFPNAWSRTNYLTSADIGNLAENQKPFILTAFTSSQNYDNPTQKSLVEEMLTIKDGGAVLSVSPSGLVFAFELLQSVNTLYRIVFDAEMTGQNAATVGEAMLMAKRELLTNSTVSDHTFRRFSILGDPALSNPLAH